MLPHKSGMVSAWAGVIIALRISNPRMKPLLAAFFALTLAASARDKTLDIYWIDSEGGGSTLIVTPEGESVLVDTGNPGGRDPQRIQKVAKEVAGLERIDHVVITHFHADHFGGLAELAALMPIGTLHDKGCAGRQPGWQTARRTLGSHASAVSRCQGGEARHDCGGR